MKVSYSKLFGLAVGIMLIAAALTPNGLAKAREVVGENEPGEDLKLAGTVEALSENSITILGLTFQISEATDIDEGLQVGDFATVEFVLGEGSTLVALEVENDADDDLDEDAGEDQDEDEGEDVGEDELEDSKLTGVVEAISETSITINGLVFTFDENTELDEGLQVGVVATIEFVTLPDGTLLTSEVETDADDGQDGEDDQDEDENDDDDSDNSGSGDEVDDDSDNSGSGDEDDDDSDNSGSGNEDDDDSDNSGSGNNEDADD